ncbi:unnamed protein product [Prunus armeniaca]
MSNSTGDACVYDMLKANFLSSQSACVKLVDHIHQASHLGTFSSLSLEKQKDVAAIQNSSAIAPSYAQLNELDKKNVNMTSKLSAEETSHETRMFEMKESIHKKAFFPAQRSQDTLNNMTTMMQWQVSRQFKKDREVAMARIPNPDVVVQQLDLPYGPPLGLAWSYQKNPLIAQIAGVQGHGEIQAGQRGGALPIQEQEGPVRPEGPALVQVQQNQPKPPPIPQLVAPRDQPLALLPDALAVLPYRSRRMDPNPFLPPARGRRGRGGINPFGNNDRNRSGAN